MWRYSSPEDSPVTRVAIGLVRLSFPWRAVICAVFSIVLLAGSAARAAEESAQDFLSRFLAQEFAGKGEQIRIGQVRYSHGGKPPIIDDPDGIWARYDYDLDSDMLKLVSDWVLLSPPYDTEPVEKNPNIRVFHVRFHTLAVTWKAEDANHHILRVILPLQFPPDEEVRYELHKGKNGWLLLDPPLPRVSVAPVLAAVTTQQAATRAQQEQAIKVADQQRQHDLHQILAYQDSELTILHVLSSP